MRCRGEQKTIIAIHVDDALVASTSDAESKQLIDELKSEFKITAKEAIYIFLDLKYKDFRMDRSRLASSAHVVQWSNHLGAMCSRA